VRLARAPVLDLSVAPGIVRAEARRNGTVVWAGEAIYESPDELVAMIGTLAAAPAERCRRLRVTLERPTVQTRTLHDIPPVRGPDLAALVAAQAGRFFRRNGSPLVTDAVWVKNGHGLMAQAAAVEEPVVVAIAAGAREAGLLLERIGATGTSADLQLLPGVERVARARDERRLLLRLGALLVGVWALAGLLFLTRFVRESRAVDRELAAAQAPLAALRDVRREMRIVEGTVLAVDAARQNRGRALTALASVSAAFPDSGMITSFTWRSDGSGVLAGLARRAAEVLAALERSQTVPNPRIEGPVVREAVAGREWDRFTIVFGKAAN
jgi:hypothetical protein